MTVLRSPITVWVAFIVAHLWLGMLGLYAPGLPLGDVTIVYKFWMDEALNQNLWVGIDTAWVYPIVALVPMLLAMVFGPDQYAATWLSMIMLLNAVAFGFITGWGRSRERIGVAWWWIGFLVLLGPIALGRIDAVTVPLAIIAVLLIARRPGAAAILLAIAMWIKVWPAAIVGAAIIALKDRLRITAGVLVTSVVIMVIALLVGSGTNVLSFITEQTGRGLQIEAPVSTIWLWQAAFGVPGTYVYYDHDILTYQIAGNGVGTAAALMNPLLVLAFGVIAFLGFRATRRGVPAGDLFPPLALAFVMALIAFNKVGSPQYVTWLAVPIVLGLATSAAGHGRSFRTPAILVLAIAGLTQFIYPYLYGSLLSVEPFMVGTITIRNLLYFVVLGWATHAIVTATTLEHFDDDDWLPSVWPLKEPETVEEHS